MVTHPTTTPPNIVIQLVLGPIAGSARDAFKGAADRWIEVEDVIHRSTHADGVSPFSEQFLRGMAEPELGHWHVLARVNGRVSGVAAVDPRAAAVEMAVHPHVRRMGIGSSLVRAVRAHAAASGVGSPRNIYTGSLGLLWWAHGDIPAAQKAAAFGGATPARELLVMDMGRDAIAQAVDALGGPETVQDFGSEVTILNYVESAERFGADFVDKAWLAVNNEAFHWHPEQGHWSPERLNFARATEWYDPEGVLFMWCSNSIAANTPRLMGFHWTKLRTETFGDLRRIVGEVYVIGLADAARGRGWGRALTAEGVRYLASRGAEAVELYVEANNAPAIKAYEALGFSVSERHTAYRV